MRGLDELTDVDDPAWPALEGLFADTSVALRVLPVDPAEARRSLLQIQITARSALGAMALHCGGLVIDDGWVRVFGGGSSGGGSSGGGSSGGGSSGGEDVMPSLAQINDFPTVFDPGWIPTSGLIVGYDVLGGVFALNGHDPAAVGRPGVPGQMTYFAPDSLEREAMEMGYSTWAPVRIRSTMTFRSHTISRPGKLAA